jgi:hypothetical protein
MNRLLKIINKLQRVQPAARRHLLGRNSIPYERILQDVRAMEDLWVTTQGEYMQWWSEREALSFSVQSSQGECHVRASLPRAVIEHFPGRFLDSETVATPQATFMGECVITVDSGMKYKESLIEILRREGILNYQISDKGDFFLSREELDPLLEQATAKMESRLGQFEKDDVNAVREIVIQKLAAHNLPLLRVWYHPRVKGFIPKAVFSPRYDVDRAITNMEKIRKIEMKYGVESTFYIRAFCPFYSDQDVADLSAMPWCPELALHGEFVTNAQSHGNELKAARAEKIHLETLANLSIRGAGMHGGELTSNRTPLTNEALSAASILYDTTPRPRPGNYLPFRLLVDGKFSNVYGLPHALSDVNIDADRHYGKVFHETTMETMREIYKANGVFVLMLHPEYFGFFNYLSKPANLRALIKFMRGYLTGSAQSQVRPEMVGAQKDLVAK